MKTILTLLALMSIHQPGLAQDDSPRRLTIRKGFYNHTDLGTLLGQVIRPFVNDPVTYSRSSFTANTFNGYRFTRGLIVGATVGVDWYARNAVMPVSLGLRGDMGKRRVNPCYMLDVGYGLSLARPAKVTGAEVSTSSGLHLNPALGIRIATGNDTALILSIGYKYQRMESSIRYNNQGTTISNEFNYNRLALKVGMSF